MTETFFQWLGQVSVGAELDFGDCYSGVGAEVLPPPPPAPPPPHASRPHIQRCRARHGAAWLLIGRITALQRDVTLRNMTEQDLFVTFSNDRSNDRSHDGTVSFRMKESDGGKDGAAVDDDVPLPVTAEKGQSQDHLGNDEPMGPRTTKGKDLARGKSSKIREKDNLQELSLKPGASKVITCTYRPARPKLPDQISLKLKPPSRKLTRHAFRMWLRCRDDTDRVLDKYSKMLPCRARVCTSWLLLEKCVLNFGDANVGAQVTQLVRVSNLSEMPATLSIRSQSQVLFFHPRGSTTIPAKQTYDIKVQFAPKFLDPNFQKLVQFVNNDNTDNEQILEVRANITDQHRVTFHSLFYSVVTRAPNEIVNFGDCVANNKIVRTVKVVNKSDMHGLSLILKTDSPEFSLYMDNSAAKAVEDQMAVDRSARRSSPSGTAQKNVLTAAAVAAAAAAAAASQEAMAALPKFRGIKEQLQTSSEEPPMKNPSVKHHPNPLPDEHRTLSRTLSESRGPGPHRDHALRRRRRESFDDSGMADNWDYKMANEQDLAVATQFNHNVHTRSASPKVVAPRHNPRTGSPEALPSKASRTLSDVFEEVANSSASPPQPAERNKEKGNAKEKKREVPARTELQRIVDVQSALSSFESSAAEVRHVEAAIAQRDLINRLTHDRHLVESAAVNLPPGGEQIIYIVFEGHSRNGPDNLVALQNRSAKVLFHLAEYESTIASSEGVEIPDVIPVREVPLRARVCVSKMSLQQKSINFGKMYAGDEQVRFLILSNESEVPLLYNIVKTGKEQPLKAALPILLHTPFNLIGFSM